MGDCEPIPNTSEHPKKDVAELDDTLDRLTDRQRLFLSHFADLGTIRYAAKASGIGRTCHYDWLAGDDYRKAFESAKDQAVESLEHEAIERAKGWLEPVLDKDGNHVGDRRKYSDVLLIFLLKGALPEKYRENSKVEHSVSKDGDVVFYVPDTEK